jgi:hypothetical protein
MSRTGVLIIVISLVVLFPADQVFAQCQSCTTPCDEHFECSNTWGTYLDCRNVKNCGGCIGWYCEMPAAAIERAKDDHFNQTFILAAVTVERNYRQPNEWITGGTSDSGRQQPSETP